MRKEVVQAFENTTVLVVGGAGFVGSKLVKELLTNQPNKVHIVDNLLSADKINIPNDTRVKFSHSSITSDDMLKSLNDEYDYVFHLATFHGNQSSIYDPLKDHENNTLTTLKLYDTIKKFSKIKKVVYSSAGCSIAEKTFDKANPSKEVEFVSLTMDSPYSMSKIFGEFYSNYYFKQHQLPTVRARFQNVYGPGEILGAGEWRGTPATIWRNVIPTFIFKSIHGKALPVENEGIATRDFIYVTDVVRGLMLCAIKGVAGQAYNIASGRETSILDLANKINSLTGNLTPVRFLPKRNWDNSGKRFGSTEKAKSDIEFEAHISLDAGLQQTISWTRQNLPEIERCMRQHQKHYDYAQDMN